MESEEEFDTTGGTGGRPNVTGGTGGRGGTQGGVGGTGGFVSGGTAGFGTGSGGFESGGTAGGLGDGGTGGNATGGTPATGGSGGSGGVCGNGVVERGEGCDLGAGNEDRPAFEVRQAGRVTPIIPLRTPERVQLFYDYRNASSHTGFEAIGHSRMLLHFDTTDPELSLVMHHGQDLTSPDRQARARVKFTLSGLPSTTAVALSDEFNELRKTAANTAEGDWNFILGNTDGGALGPLPFPGTWTVKVVPLFEVGITQWEFVDGDKSLSSLAINEPIEIRAYDSASRCRRDCTLPSCGDGILDGGEICDDGNRTPNDGCSADCKSLR